MPRLGEVRLPLQQALSERYGPLPVPGGGANRSEETTPFEAIARVALALAAEPRTAMAAQKPLRDAGLLEPEALAAADPTELDDLFRSNRLKLTSKDLKPLRGLAGWWSGQALGAEGLSRLSTEAIRDDLRALNGVGSTSADSILLFALNRATYPVDRGSYRIFVRHGWLDPSSDSDEARSVLESVALDDPASLAQLSAGLVRIAREACKPAAPSASGARSARSCPTGVRSRRRDRKPTGWPRPLPLHPGGRMSRKGFRQTRATARASPGGRDSAVK